MAAQRQGESWCVLGDEPSPQRYLAATLPLVHQAAQTYFDWLFGGRDEALRHLARWLSRPSSEVALERSTLLLEQEVVVGAFAALSGADLADCRLADGRALVTATARQDRAALLARLGAVRSLFAPVASDDWYLSKLAVPAPARGRGLGGRLLEAYLDRGAAAGYSRYRLDVEAGNTAAIKLYEARGFRVMHDASSDSAKLHYLGMAMEA